MKPLVALISIFLVVFFSYICAFAQPAQPQMPPDMRRIIENTPPASHHKSTKDTNEPAADVNSVVDTNDPNAVKASYRKFMGLEEALEHLNGVAEKETREWMRPKTEDKTALAEAVQEQIVKELTFIRELAVEEKAAKTTAAIDGLLMMRKDRFNATVKKIEDIKRLEEKRAKKDEAGRRREREHTPKRRETPDRRI